MLLDDSVITAGVMHSLEQSLVSCAVTQGCAHDLRNHLCERAASNSSGSSEWPAKEVITEVEWGSSVNLPQCLTEFLMKYE